MIELAEASTRFERLAPTEALLEADGFVIFFAPGDDARSCLVQRPRFAGSSVEATVERARCLIRSHGRREATWEILTPVHAPPTIDRLRALGLRPGAPAQATIMALSTAPRVTAAGVTVSAVDTLDDFRAHVAITHEVFGLLDRLPAELQRIDVEGAGKLADRSFVRYLARVDGVAAGAATATFTSAGVMLHSGSTLARFRGRGVYAATVLHRWHEAVARGTPQLITRAGPMSCEILRKLGFVELGQVHFLIDVFP